MPTKTTIRRVVEELGEAKEIHSGLKEFSRRVQYLEDHRTEFIKKHPNKWIALFGNKIVSVGDSIQDILDDVDGQGISRKATVIDYLDTERRTMVL